LSSAPFGMEVKEAPDPENVVAVTTPVTTAPSDTLRVPPTSSFDFGSSLPIPTF